MKLLNGIMLLMITTGLIAVPAPCFADEPLGGAFTVDVNTPAEFEGEVVTPLPDGEPVVISESDDVTITSTGNRWVDDDGLEVWEYEAKIAVSSKGGISWSKLSEMTYSIDQEGISAMVSGATAIIYIGSGYLRWTPTVKVSGITYHANGNPIVIDDNSNSDYKDNVIQWDYDICKRYMRAIDGMISETFVFDTKPSGDIVIDIGVDPTSTMEAGDVYAYDANGLPVAVSLVGGTKVITQLAMENAVFPITIDPTKQVRSEAFDSIVYDNYAGMNYPNNFAGVWNGSVGVIGAGNSNPIYTGSYFNSIYMGFWGYNNTSTIWRGALYFNTSSIYGAEISNASVYLYATDVVNDNSSYHPPLGRAILYRGINDSSTWSIPSDYPHKPVWTHYYYPLPPYGQWASGISTNDYYDAKYITGSDYLGRTTNNVTTNSTWYTIELNQNGIDIIDTTTPYYAAHNTSDHSIGAWTRFSLRIEREVNLITDWNGSDFNHYFGGYQRVSWASGSSSTTTKPYLYVLYMAYAPPVPRTDVATKIKMTTARINGYLQYDGGHQCRVGLRYKQSGTTNWSTTSAYYGDVTGDGWVTADDYDLIDEYLNGGYLTADQILRADVNQDGNVTSDDYDEVGLVLAGGKNYAVYLSANASTGTLFYKDLASLNITTTYNFSTFAMHEKFQADGITNQFTTLSGMGDPSGLRAVPEVGGMFLTWESATGSDATEVRYKANSYPSDNADGILACRTAETSYDLQGLTGGTVYYFRAWGYSPDSGGTYSLNYSEAFAGTPAGVTGGGTGSGMTSIEKIPLQNTSDWFNSPQAARLSKLPGYALINEMADALSMPYNTWWFLLSMGFCIVMGMFMFFRTNQMLLGFITVLALVIIFCMIGTLPVWITIVFSLSTLGFSWRELR